ncbi:MAG: T9SS type A sorting domain-containing protein [Balneolales bacterium]
MISKILTLFAFGMVFLSGNVTAQKNELPQDHEYQVVLRNYMASLSQQDFDVPFNDITYDDNHLNSLSNDELYGLWLIFQDAPPQGPIASVKGLIVNSSHFKLSSIENDGIRMGSSNNRPWIPSETTAWWYGWAYKGNPYYKHKGVMRRAFVASAVEMIMLDNAHKNGKATRSDYLGGTLIWLAYTYSQVKDDLPESVCNAYEKGLLKFLGRLEDWGSNNNMGDMDQSAHVGLWYLAKAIDDPEVYRRVENQTASILNTDYRPAGYIQHGDGFDAPYNGFSLYYLNWAAMASKNPLLKQTVGEMSKLKAHLSLPEPGGRMQGPSHFNTTTSTDPANDLNESTIRDVGTALHSDHAKYLVWEGRNGQNFNVGVPTRTDMKSRISLLTRRTNDHFTASAEAPEAWHETHWGTGIPHAGPYIEPGFYDELLQLESSNSPLMQAPFNRTENFIEQFPHEYADVPENRKREFLSAKFDNYGVILHTGLISWWGGTDTDVMSGFGGGAISAFWTKKGGSVILGRSAGFQGPQPDTWNNWRQWPTHAISGLSADNEPFSSARNRSPIRQYHVNENSATVTVTGIIGDEHDGGRSTLNDAMPNLINYNRNFKVDASGLTVETKISSDGQDEVKELYEIIPLYLGNGSNGVSQAGVHIEVETDGTWHNASSDLKENVDKIRIQRYTETVYITFDSPQNVKLSPTPWEDQYQSSLITRNILIDLLDNDGERVTIPESAAVSYTVSTVSQKPTLIETTINNAPRVLAPENLATNIDLNPIIKWEEVDGAESYRFRMTLDKNFENTEININDIRETQIQLHALDPNTVYYYAVESKTGENSGEWSAVRSFTTSNTPTSIDESGVPKSFELLENYPNPFNPTTQISYSLPEAGFVSLEVYDITGRLITTLVNETQTPGQYHVEFKADDLASGVYIYRLKANDFVQTKQMTLIK